MKTLARMVLMVLALGGNARAGEMEKLAEGAEKQMTEIRLRLLGPSGSTAVRDTHGRVIPVGGFWGAAPMAPGRKGGAAGVEMEYPVNRIGLTNLVSISGFGAKAASHDTGRQVWNKRGIAGMIGFGMRQRLFRAGLGDRRGNGVFLEPVIGAGLTAVGWTWEETTTEDGKRTAFTQRAAFPPYIEAGLDLVFGRQVAVGVVARRYSTLVKDGHHASLFGFGVTIPQTSPSWGR